MDQDFLGQQLQRPLKFKRTISFVKPYESTFLSFRGTYLNSKFIIINKSYL